ncbi:protein C19orf12 homolog [Tribolium castaneum]|uniref:Uncharacterized protein n=1 Tax=Tribolium castaneum TaxID=7070 RepID=D6WTV6_TRICA|nr:PREDICTED: protein C19orf12 homolog [Tribolium castaneum]EFA07338.1 hypothetical protein TcasGA2_TC015934 [Tribolium castaneum]|eukprot:XP_976181.1 PREDICTED: protein C19orf12 homolog [Tribolium castaneum]
MPLSQRDIIRVCEILAEQEQLECTVRHSLVGACYAFGGALLGGILGGPVGLGVGSAAGGALAAYKSQGKFKSAAYVIMFEMTERDRQRLADAVGEVIRSIDASDVITVVTLLNTNALLRNSALEVLKRFLTNDVGVKFVQ